MTDNTRSRTLYEYVNIDASNAEYIASIPNEKVRRVVERYVPVLNDLDPDWKVTQIKMKFGGYRFYIETTNENARLVAHLVELAMDLVAKSEY